MSPFFRRLPLVLAVAAPLATLAQSPRHRLMPEHSFGSETTLGGHSRPADSLLHSKRQAYVQANVLPVLRQQRQQLETQLAPADQVALAGYRAQLNELRTQRQVLRKHLRPNAGIRPELTDEQRQQARALRAKEWEIMSQVRVLGYKYEANLRQLAEKQQPQRAQWAADLRAMLPPRPAAALVGQHRPGSFHHSPLGELLRPSAFLLLEPSAPTETTLGSNSLYPNPVVANTQLHYEVKQAGTVRVELLDAQGTPLRTLLAEAATQPGTYTQPLDFSTLSSGTYFYKITTAAGTQTKRFVKE